MNRKKILYLITKGSPYGGAQKYVYDLVTNLPTDQFEPVVLVGFGEDLQKKIETPQVAKQSLLRGRRDTRHEIRIIRVPEMGRDINIITEWKVFWKLIKIILAEKPNIVHLNSSKVSGLGSLAVFLIRISYLVTRNSSRAPRAIFTVHGWAFNEKRSFVSVFIIKFLSWITVLLSHKTIVISKSEEAQAITFPFVRNKIKLVYNGIEKIDFKNKTEAREFLVQKAVTRTVLVNNNLWIGTIAELHKNKNLFALIQVMRWLKENVILVIIGDGEERKNLEHQIEEHNLKDKVFLTGKIENAGEYLKAFDIFVLPSVKEGLPYTLLEAGLAELPCLSTYVGGIPEIIRNNVSGVLVEPNSKKITEGLEFLISNPEKAKEFGKNLKEKISPDFSLEKMVEETIKIYRE